MKSLIILLLFFPFFVQAEIHSYFPKKASSNGFELEHGEVLLQDEITLDSSGYVLLISDQAGIIELDSAGVYSLKQLEERHWKELSPLDKINQDRLKKYIVNKRCYSSHPLIAEPRYRQSLLVNTGNWYRNIPLTIKINRTTNNTFIAINNLSMDTLLVLKIEKQKIQLDSTIYDQIRNKDEIVITDQSLEESSNDENGVNCSGLYLKENSDIESEYQSLIQSKKHYSPFIFHLFKLSFFHHHKMTNYLLNTLSAGKSFCSTHPKMKTIISRSIRCHYHLKLQPFFNY